MPDTVIPVNSKYAQQRFATQAAPCYQGFMINLRDIRKSRGLTQVQLAEKVGCAQSVITRMERGEGNPTLNMIEAVAQALNVSPVSLFGLPEVQRRAVDALDNLPPEDQAAALQILEALARQKV